ncbi:MAG: aldo/keto reductase [Proteobacteria bacterium]|nr:aldo/keto reductase [Pseudomonadota bacterium]
MKQLGKLWPVSGYTLGGGGIGQVWGATDREEAVLTVEEAINRGVTLLDLAPMYGRGEAEAVVGEAFNGHLPEGVSVTSKCLLGTDTPEATLDKLERSITRSLEALRLSKIDLFFLHSQIIEDDYVFEGELAETQNKWSVTLEAFDNAVRPAFERLKSQGLINAWGITGTGHPNAIEHVMQSDTPPAAVQLISNLLDSPGSLKRYPEPARPRALMQIAQSQGIGIMGIRAVQAGALCAAFDRTLPEDHPEQIDYRRAAPFRALCDRWHEDPAVIAHRYARSIPEVDTVVLGVKNRTELRACLDNDALLSRQQIAAIDDLKLR